MYECVGSGVVYYLYGSFFEFCCVCCGVFYIDVFLEMFEFVIEVELLVCDCGGLIWFDIVWFGELLLEELWWSVVEVIGSVDVMVVVGILVIVYLVVGLFDLVLVCGIVVIEVNFEFMLLFGSVMISICELVS